MKEEEGWVCKGSSGRKEILAFSWRRLLVKGRGKIDGLEEQTDLSFFPVKREALHLLPLGEKEEQRSGGTEWGGSSSLPVFLSETDGWHRQAKGPMRRPKEGGWEGLSVHPPRPNRGQLALRAQTGPLPRRLLLLLILLFFILVVRVVHQPNQCSLRETTNQIKTKKLGTQISSSQHYS